MSDRDSSPDFAELKSGSKKRILGISAIAAVVVVGGLFYAMSAANAEADTQLRAATSAVRDCLLVGPLDEGETPLLRFRRLQLDVMGFSDADVELQRETLWPLRCAKPAVALKDLIRTANLQVDVQPLTKLVEFVETTGGRYEDPSQVLEPALKLMDDLSPAAIGNSGEQTVPHSVLNQDSLRKFTPVSKHGTAMSESYTEQNPGISLPVLIAEETLEAPVLCQFHADGTAHCDDLGGLAKVKGHGFRLLGTSDESSKTLIFAGRRGSEGVFVAGEDKPLANVYSYGGYASNDGSAAILGWNEGERKAVLIERDAKGKVQETKLNPNFRVGNYFYSSQLLWDQLVVRGVTPDNERRLFTLPVGGSGTEFSLVDVGELDEPGRIRPGEEEQAHIAGCRTKEATIIRIRGDRNDFLTFRIGDKFTMPVHGPTWGVLGCHGTTASMTLAAYAQNGTKIYHSVCTSAGCKDREFPATALDRNSTPLRPNDVRNVQAVDIAGQILAVWKAGDRGGLRMRMAKPDLFEQQKDVVLFDDLIADGKVSDLSSILGFRLYSRQDFAVLLMSNMAGLYAFRIATNGQVTPFEVKN